MAFIDWDDVEDIAPELTAVNGVNTEAQGMILDVVNNNINIAGFGGEDDGRLKLARCYLAAHFGQITKDKMSAGGGPLSAEAAGGLSRSYAVMPSNSELGTTVWGRAYLSIIRMTLMPLPDVL